MSGTICFAAPIFHSHIHPLPPPPPPPRSAWEDVAAEMEKKGYIRSVGALKAHAAQM